MATEKQSAYLAALYDNLDAAIHNRIVSINTGKFASEELRQRRLAAAEAAERFVRHIKPASELTDQQASKLIDLLQSAPHMVLVKYRAYPQRWTWALTTPMTDADLTLIKEVTLL